MTVRVYTRVSSQAQTEGYSLTAQREKAEAWARYQDLGEVRVYEERGISGGQDDRPQLLLLLGDLQQGDTVVIYALSRLGRGGAVQLLGIVRDIEARGARLVSLTEAIDTITPAGRLLLTILAALTAMEVEITRERALSGKMQAASSGHWPLGNQTLPLAWGRGPDRTIVVREDELPTWTRLMELARAGTPYRSIAATLNAEGYRSRKGGKWGAVLVRKLVMFPGYYTGEMAYTHTVEGLPQTATVPAPALMTAEEWREAQRTGSDSSAWKKPEHYPLTGHLVCGCGARMYGLTMLRKSRKVRYYACRELNRHTPICREHGRASNHFQVEQINGQAREALATVLGQPEALQALVGVAEPAPDTHERERAALERRRAAVLDLYLDELIDRDEFEARRAVFDRKLARLAQPAIPSPVDVSSLTAYQDAALLLKGEAWRDLLRLLEVRFVVTRGRVTGVASLAVPRLRGAG